MTADEIIDQHVKDGTVHILEERLLRIQRCIDHAKRLHPRSKRLFQKEYDRQMLWAIRLMP